MPTDPPVSAHRKVANAAINRAFQLAPASLISRRHERNNVKFLRPLLRADPLFIHVPKSGGQSVSAALGRSDAGHFTFERMREIDPTVIARRAYFTVLRDPVDRVMSTYWYVKRLHRDHGTSTIPQVHQADDLDDFVTRYLRRIKLDSHYFLRPASRILRGAPPDRTFVVNFDNLSDSFGQFSRQVLGHPIDLPHVNDSPRLGERGLSIEAEGTIRELYSKDVEWHAALRDRPYAKLAEFSILRTSG